MTQRLTWPMRQLSEGIEKPGKKYFFLGASFFFQIMIRWER